MPLLSHVGYELSLIGKDQSVGDPNRLRMVLDAGVTVIAAHACSDGLMFYEKVYPTLLDSVETSPNFSAYISALTLPNRFKMLLACGSTRSASSPSVWNGLSAVGLSPAGLGPYRDGTGIGHQEHDESV